MTTIKTSKKGLSPLLLATGLMLGLIQNPVFAAEVSPAEMKLREMVRSTMLQLREAQTKIDTLTVAQAQSDREKAEQKKKIEELVHQSEMDKKAADKEREKAAIRIVMLDRLVADHETKNGELIKLSKEILTRYEKFGLGDALTAKEPFIGLTRVKIQNFVQDYEDKVSEQRIAHGKKEVPKNVAENQPDLSSKEEEKPVSKTDPVIQDPLPSNEEEKPKSKTEPENPPTLPSKEEKKPLSKTKPDESDPKEIIHEKKSK